MNKIEFRRIGASLVLLLILMVPNKAWTQACPLSLRISHTPVTQLSVGDIDFEHFQSNTLLFTIAVSNPTSEPYDVTLSIVIGMKLADGFVKPGAVSYLSLPFPIPPGGRTFSNLDIGATSIDIKTDNFYYDQEAKDKVHDVALGTGRFPAGRYSFDISLPSCVGASHEKFDLLLQNPSRVELRSPVDGELTNQFPLFEFYVDAGTAELIVAELTPGQSPTDAINRRPTMLDVELQNQNSYFYAGGRPLEQDKSYVWQVIGKSTVTGGSQLDIKSEIRKFTVSSASGGLSEDELLRQIEEILGPKYKSIFDKIRTGEFKLTGKYTNNSTPLSQGELLNLVNELRNSLDNTEIVFE